MGNVRNAATFLALNGIGASRFNWSTGQLATLQIENSQVGRYDRLARGRTADLAQDSSTAEREEVS